MPTGRSWQDSDEDGHVVTTLTEQELRIVPGANYVSDLICVEGSQLYMVNEAPYVCLVHMLSGLACQSSRPSPCRLKNGTCIGWSAKIRLPGFFVAMKNHKCQLPGELLDVREWVPLLIRCDWNRSIQINQHVESLKKKWYRISVTYRWRRVSKCYTSWQNRWALCCRSIPQKNDILLKSINLGASFQSRLNMLVLAWCVEPMVRSTSNLHSSLAERIPMSPESPYRTQLHWKIKRCKSWSKLGRCLAEGCFQVVLEKKLARKRVESGVCNFCLFMFQQDKRERGVTKSKVFNGHMCLRLFIWSTTMTISIT